VAFRTLGHPLPEVGRWETGGLLPPNAGHGIDRR